MRVSLYADDFGLLGWLLLGRVRMAASSARKNARRCLLLQSRLRALAIAFQREKADGEWNREGGALRGMIDCRGRGLQQYTPLV
ncbi:MAG: hypothetical protein WAM90_00015 [Rhodanobacter sp.]